MLSMVTWWDIGSRTNWGRAKRLFYHQDAMQKEGKQYRGPKLRGLKKSRGEMKTMMDQSKKKEERTGNRKAEE